MKVKQKHWGGTRQMSICAAVEAATEPDFDRRGVAEDARDVADKTRQMLGRIVAELHTAGSLSDSDRAEHPRLRLREG